jgi:hypothetical protein
VVSETHVPTAARQSTVAQLREIAADYAGGYREGLTREAALAELSAACTDPDLLAEAAAAHAIADNWFAITAVDLLLAAGADPHRIDQHVDWSGPAASCDQSHDFGRSI